MNENQLGTLVLNAAIAVHRERGSGLLESDHEEGNPAEAQRR